MINKETIECPSCLGEKVTFNPKKGKDEECIICDSSGKVSAMHYESYVDSLNPDL